MTLDRRLDRLERETRSLKLWLVIAVLTAGGALGLAINATLELNAGPAKRDRARITVLPESAPPPATVAEAEPVEDERPDEVADVSWSRKRKSWQADGLDAVSAKGGTGEVSARDQVNQLIRSRQRELVECVQAEQRRDEKFGGAFQVVFDVQPSGRASNVALSKGVRSTPQLRDCLADRLGRWRFPTFQGPAYQVRLPFNITP